MPTIKPNLREVTVDSICIATIAAEVTPVNPAGRQIRGHTVMLSDTSQGVIVVVTAVLRQAVVAFVKHADCRLASR